MISVWFHCTRPVVALSNRLKMTQYLFFVFIFCVIAPITRLLGHPPVSSQPQRTCFNSFDNFDECWEKIEELCLNEATGEFDECYKEDTGYAEEDPNYTETFPHSEHCYTRSSGLTIIVCIYFNIFHSSVFMSV